MQDLVRWSSKLRKHLTHHQIRTRFMSHDESSKGCCGSCKGSSGKCGGAQKGHEITDLRSRQKAGQDEKVQPAATLSELIEIQPQPIES